MAQSKIQTLLGELHDLLYAAEHKMISPAKQKAILKIVGVQLERIEAAIKKVKAEKKS